MHDNLPNEIALLRHATVPLDTLTYEQLNAKLKEQQATLQDIEQVLETFGVGYPGEGLAERIQRAILHHDRAMKIALRKIQETRELREMVDDLFDPP